MSLKRKYAHEWRESWEKIDTIRDVMRQFPHHEWFWWLDLVYCHPPFKVLILAAYIHHGTIPVARGSDFLATPQNCVSRYLQDTQPPQHIRDCICRYIQANGHFDLTRLRWIQFGEFSCKAESVYSTRVRYVVGSSLL
jgi:hypothetical protein